MPEIKPRKTLFNPELRRRGIYVLPNLFTTAALFCGFFAIVQAMKGSFEQAAVAIFVAMVLDGLDGRIARLTNTQSDFGAEYDSLSDMVSFGAAPALVMYEWALRDLGRLGWIAAFVYCVGAALRLARFNTQLSVADKRWFTGLPSPAAGLLVAGMIWVLGDYQVKGGEVKWWAAALTVYAGITMVSNIRFYSGKDFNLRRAVPFWMTLVIVVALLLVSIEPSHVLWGIMVAYGLSGYAMWVVNRARSQADERKYQGIRDAIDAGDMTALSRMLNATPADTVLGEDGRTVFMSAVEESNLPALELMVSRGAALDLKDKQGSTALAIAAQMGYQEAVEVLLAAGADPNVADAAGLTALDLAEEHGAHDTVAALLKAGARPGREVAPPPAA